LQPPWLHPSVLWLPAEMQGPLMASLIPSCLEGQMIAFGNTKLVIPDFPVMNELGTTQNFVK
jgi:hypothetical protein